MEVCVIYAARRTPRCAYSGWFMCRAQEVYFVMLLMMVCVVEKLRFMSDINQPGLPIPFYSVFVSVSFCIALSTVFHSINSPDSSPFSHSVVPVLSLRYRFVYESLLQP